MFHSLLDNGVKMTPKRRSVFSLIFIVKGSAMLKIKIKVNDVIQAPKNKSTSMHDLNASILRSQEHLLRKNI